MSPETCFKRWLTANPFSGSSARIFNNNRSRVPCTKSFGLLMLSSLTEGRLHLLLSVSKGKIRSTDIPVGDSLAWPQITNNPLPLPSVCGNFSQLEFVPVHVSSKVFRSNFHTWREQT